MEVIYDVISDVSDVEIGAQKHMIMLIYWFWGILAVK